MKKEPNLGASSNPLIPKGNLAVHPPVKNGEWGQWISDFPAMPSERKLLKAKFHDQLNQHLECVPQINLLSTGENQRVRDELLHYALTVQRVISTRSEVELIDLATAAAGVAVVLCFPSAQVMGAMIPLTGAAIVTVRSRRARKEQQLLDALLDRLEAFRRNLVR
ncbi:hypothetical protein OF829_02980 [Sphingomonas sp. LB-2]|uniref:hypothetical protein n=1 Tax=Sphingomonas caeni TaxID=2984949 RepID=UPI00222FF8C3|nr:hypothetical protein [Sphingomonas caeni]MCW3846187.1 hypothetical protein [Sphingomonas caeni]